MRAFEDTLQRNPGTHRVLPAFVGGDGGSWRAGRVAQEVDEEAIYVNGCVALRLSSGRERRAFIELALFQFVCRVIVLAP